MIRRNANFRLAMRVGISSCLMKNSVLIQQNVQNTPFLWYWGLNSEPSPLITPLALFCEGFFRDTVSQTICPDWLQTLILLIPAS
jgi:hypothetical protein